MKHVYPLGEGRYAFRAIDPFTGEAVIHAASSPSSCGTPKPPWRKRFGKGVAVVNDNESENMRDAEDFLREDHITQYWTRPKSPKEKPFVERLIMPSACCRKETI
ncbi:MAG: hypothetical protein LBG84_09080 [Treponema sp.]|jgi:hypothetical protein|nr:hypothetical protein [Treponema sp.]